MSNLKKKLAIATAIILSSNYALAEDAPAESLGSNVAQAQANNQSADENGFYSGASIYISDKVNALLRAEPAANVRSVGVLHPGDRVIFLGYNKDRRFAQVKVNGETYWMRTGDLQSTPAAVNQLESMQSQLENLKGQVETLSNTDSGREIEELKTQVNSLKEENNNLKQALSQKDESISKLREEAKTSIINAEENRELDMQMRWWIQGALIALGGAIAGIIFMMLPRPRRQRQNRY